jgi:hypothetical protein
MAITSAGPVGTASYLSSAYARTGSSGGGGAGTSSGDSTPSSATLVTLSAAAQAALAHATVAGLSTVIADARAALDALYKAAKVTGPLADDKQTIDLASLDRRALYAIAGNGGQKFTADEQKVAANELAERFDAVLAPQTAVARLTGDWSQTYKAALDYMQGASPEEKATAAWKAQVQALQQGYDAALAAPGSPPPAVADDPVAVFLARSGTGAGANGNLRDFSHVAKDTRAALDLQAQAAEKKGLALIYDPGRKQGQMIDLAGFDNRALAAIALNQGDQFSPEEIRAAKVELDARTRASLLATFKQSGSSPDPRAFSLGLIYNYAQMSAEERQATNFTADFRDTAVKNYQATSSLISMLQQAGASGTGLFG